jgi:hypothetical protein
MALSLCYFILLLDIYYWFGTVWYAPDPTQIDPETRCRDQHYLLLDSLLMMKSNETTKHQKKAPSKKEGKDSTKPRRPLSACKSAVSKDDDFDCWL